MSNGKQKVWLESMTLAVVGALLRIIPHPPNFAPIAAVSLLGGAKISGWQAYLVPLAAMLATDPILSYLAGYPAFNSGTPVVYLCLLLSVLLARVLLKPASSRSRLASVILLSSLQFFLITNLAVWLQSSDLYPHTVPGLLACYTAALPFFARSLAGDLFYSAVLFTVYSQLRRRNEQAAIAS